MTTPGGLLGDALGGVTPWLTDLLIIGVASARFAFAFLLVPVFSSQIMPATVRNSMIVAFGLVALTLPRPFDANDLGAAEWVWVIAKEAIAGTVIGFFFASIVWAIGAAGELVDTQVGATIGQIVDPLSQQQQSLNSIALSRFAQLVFVVAGGLTLLVGTIMQSYAIWPIGLGGLRFDPGSEALFRGEFGRLMLMASLAALPVIVILFLIDLGMGLLNRFAQNFNVFQLAMPIKAMAATFLLILLLPMLAAAIAGDVAMRPGVATDALRSVATPTGGPESALP